VGAPGFSPTSPADCFPMFFPHLESLYPHQLFVNTQCCLVLVG
jgi:hypothetical protein